MYLTMMDFQVFALIVLVVIIGVEPNQSISCPRDLGILHCSEPVIVSVVWDNSTEQYAFINGTVNNRVAWANFSDQISVNGWSYLKVVTNESWPDEIQAYAAGLAEGYVTTDLIYLHWMNTINGYCKQADEEGYCDRLYDYLEANQNYIDKQLSAFASTDSYWHQVDLIQRQLRGIERGFQNSSFLRDNESGIRRSILQDFGFLFFNIGGDIEDLEAALNKTTTHNVLGSGSCSALIKLLPNNEDLLTAQTTWNGYQSMLRILKKYEFHYHETAAPDSAVVPGVNMTFSSYPGGLYSLDDFYIVSTGLTTLETTIGNSNRDLWKYVTPQTVLEFIRSMTANRLATNGQQWTTYFLKYNSGTYNNQWMVVDYKKFQPFQRTLKNGLLWVAEQLPGMTFAEDRTDTLRNQSYWPSYNLPYFPVIYNMSGNPEMVEQFGDFFSYERSPRALIFKRDHSKVVDFESMRKLMRYNDFKNDPLARCDCIPPFSAENAIAARCDLNPVNGTYPIPALGHRSHGATDLKLTSSSLMSNLQFQATSGPTCDDQPPFQWSAFEEGDTTPHLGHPDVWNFNPIITQWE